MGKFNMGEYCKSEYIGMLPIEGKLADKIEECIEAASYNEQKELLEVEIQKIKKQVDYLKRNQLEKARFPGTSLQWKIEGEKMLIGLIGDF